MVFKAARHLRLFILARILLITLFLASTILLKLSDADAIGNIQFRGIVELLLVSAGFSLLSLIVSNYKDWFYPLARLQIVWDILFVTLLLMLTEGIASPYSFLYLLAIMNAGMLLDRRQALYTAALCIILYGTMVDMQYYGLLQEIGLDPEQARQRGDLAIFYTIFLHLIGFVLAALMGSFLVERTRETEVNYAELKRLHSGIVESLDSGLLTINVDGLIQVFNPYMERLTGVSQEEAYNRGVFSIFPRLPPVKELLDVASRGEFIYHRSENQALNIGYAAVRLDSHNTKESGIILTIKDLTRIKQMEAALKRSDHLAALGELSARMAHEIRNPLAAISGSVQLLSVKETDPGDTRLLAILLRESERLNGLITNFLTYARPPAPVLKLFNLPQLFSELELLLSADPRFNSTKLVFKTPERFGIYADRGQIQQVLLNLLCNGADAMAAKGGGAITLSVRELPETGMAELKVADQGSGFAKESMGHLFEPFWTTRPNGSGLGLATVYRIVEGHNGQIQVDSTIGEGAVITLLLPMGKGGGDEAQGTDC